MSLGSDSRRQKEDLYRQDRRQEGQEELGDVGWGLCVCVLEVKETEGGTEKKEEGGNPLTSSSFLKGSKNGTRRGLG